MKEWLIVRTWRVKAHNTHDALRKAKHTKHEEVKVTLLKQAPSNIKTPVKGEN